MDYFMRCQAVMESEEVLVTHSEVPEELWRSCREAAVQSARDGIQWLADLRGETPVGDIEFIVIEPGFPAREIERGTL